MSYILSTPTLQDILHDKYNGSYNRTNFIEFLKSNHCVENYEFVVEVNHYNSLSGSRDRIGTWKHIIRHFLLDESPKEINLPCSLRNELNSCPVPNSETLRRAYVIILELLSDSYGSFVAHTRKRHAQRRNSSSQAPETARKGSLGRNGSVEYPKSPPDGLGGSGLRHNSFSATHRNVNRIPSPQSDFEAFSAGNSSSAGSKSRANSNSSKNSNNSIVDWKKMKFKFRRNSNE